MANTLKVAPTLYSKPPKAGVPGLSYDYRTMEVLAADVESTTQILALGVLPAGHRLLDAFIECDDLDSATTLTISVGILNTYYNEAVAASGAAAAYSSGGATNTATQPELVSGQNIFTEDTIGQTGGRKDLSESALTPCLSIGVDLNKSRIIAVQFPAGATGVAGTLSIGILSAPD